MQKLFHTVLDLQGRPVEAASVRVLEYPGGGDATIYSDNGTTETPNPLTTDDHGFFEYYAADGRYTWVITTDTDEKTINDIIHQDTLP